MKEASKRRRWAAIRLAGALAGLLLAADVHSAPIAACEEGNPTERIVACDAILADAGSDAATRARALVGRGYAALFLARDKVSALADFTAAAKLDPKNAEAFIGEGKIHFYLHRDDEAEAAFATATRLDPANPVAWNTLGKVAYRRGDFSAALARFDRAIAAEHRHPNANLNRADALYKLKRKGEALAAYRFCLYLYTRSDRQYAHAVAMISQIEEELATQ